MGDHKHKRIKLSNPIELLHAKPTRGINKIIKGHIPTTPMPYPLARAREQEKTTTTGRATRDGRVLPRDLLDNGKGLLDSIPLRHKGDYAHDFCAADEGYYAGRVAATTQNRKTHWANWNKYVRPLGLDPYLQGVQYTTKVRVLTRFAARVQHGHYGRGKQVATGTVLGALTANRQEIALACGTNPTKNHGKRQTPATAFPNLRRMVQRGPANNKTTAG